MTARHLDAYERAFTATPALGGLFADPASPAGPMHRATDPETAHDAARSAIAVAGRTRRAVLDALARLGPMTDFETAAATGLQQTSAGKRRGELERAGLVEFAGHYRPAPSGARARVWQVTANGTHALTHPPSEEPRP